MWYHIWTTPNLLPWKRKIPGNEIINICKHSAEIWRKKNCAPFWGLWHHQCMYTFDTFSETDQIYSRADCEKSNPPKMLWKSRGCMKIKTTKNSKNVTISLLSLSLSDCSVLYYFAYQKNIITHLFFNFGHQNLIFRFLWEQKP